MNRRLQLFAEEMRASPVVGPVVEQAMGYEIDVTGPGGRIPRPGR